MRRGAHTQALGAVVKAPLGPRAGGTGAAEPSRRIRRQLRPGERTVWARVARERWLARTGTKRECDASPGVTGAASRLICVAPRSQMPNLLPRRALPGGRIARSRCNAGFHHGLLADSLQAVPVFSKLLKNTRIGFPGEAFVWQGAALFMRGCAPRLAYVGLCPAPHANATRGPREPHSASAGRARARPGCDRGSNAVQAD